MCVCVCVCVCVVSWAVQVISTLILTIKASDAVCHVLYKLLWCSTRDTFNSFFLLSQGERYD